MPVTTSMYFPFYLCLRQVYVYTRVQVSFTAVCTVEHVLNFVAGLLRAGLAETQCYGFTVLEYHWEIKTYLLVNRVRF